MLLRDSVKHLHAPLLYVSGLSARRESGAAPKLLSRIDSFPRHAFQHRFAAFRAHRGVGVRALFGSEGESFGGQGFCETAFGPESGQLVGQLFLQLHDQTVAED